MKRLLCIVGGMNAGGAETFLMKVYRSLDKTKYQMDFAVNIKEKGFYDDEIESLGGRIFHFPTKSESFFQYFRALKNIVKDNRYKKVLRITSNAAGFLDLAIAKIAGAEVCIARSSNSSDGKSVKAKIAHFLGRIFLKKFVDVKIAPSSEAALYTFGKKDCERGAVHILHNGLNLNEFCFTESGRFSIRREFGIASDQIVLGHVGRFSEQKNHTFLIDIFKSFCIQHPSSVLMLVGEGELKNDIQRKVQEMGLERNVIFAGVRSDMAALYSAMDVLVFPSLYEGMPNAVIEAQACGLPCVISDSITNESKITDFVYFKSLSEFSKSWTELIDYSLLMDKRKDMKCCLPEQYSILKVCSEFTRVIFG